MRPAHAIVAVLALLVVACGQASAPPASPTGAAAAPTPTPTPAVADPTPIAASAPSAGPTNAPPALAVSVLGVVPMRQFPSAVAGDHAVWSWDENTGRVLKVDAERDRVAATIALGDPNATTASGPATPYGSPKTMAVSGSAVWVTDVINHAIARIDPATSRVVERISLAHVAFPLVSGPIDPFGLAVDGTTLWVTDFDQGVVLAVDTATGTVRSAFGGVDHPEGVAVAFGSVWVVQHRLGSVARMDPRTGSVLASIDLPGNGPNDTCGMCVDSLTPGPDGIWVPLDLGDGVVRIDPADNKVVDELATDRPVDTLAPGAGVLWAPTSTITAGPCTDSSASVLRIDAATHGVTGMLTMPCAVSAAVVDGDLWVGSADAPDAFTRLRVSP